MLAAFAAPRRLASVAGPARCYASQSTAAKKSKRKAATKASSAATPTKSAPAPSMGLRNRLMMSAMKTYSAQQMAARKSSQNEPEKTEPLTEEEQQLKHVESMLEQKKMLESQGREVLGIQMPQLDVILPYSASPRSFREYGSLRAFYRQWIQNRVNDGKNAFSMRHIAVSNSFPGVYVDPTMGWLQTFFTLARRVFGAQSLKANAWVAPLRQEYLDRYIKLNQAILYGDKLDQLAMPPFIDELEKLAKNRLPGHTYFWTFHREVRPTRIISLRAVDGDFGREMPQTGTRIAVQALVRFDTEQSVEIYDRNGQPLHEVVPAEEQTVSGQPVKTGKTLHRVAAVPKRVTEYLLLDRPMYLPNSRWRFRARMVTLPVKAPLSFMPVLVLPFLLPYTPTLNLSASTMFVWVFALAALLLAATAPRLRALGAFLRAKVPVLGLPLPVSSRTTALALDHATTPTSRGRLPAPTPRRLSGLFGGLRRARSLSDAGLPRYHPPSTPPPELPVSPGAGVIPLVDLSEHSHFRRVSDGHAHGIPRSSMGWSSMSSLHSTSPLVPLPDADSASSSRAASPVLLPLPPPPAHSNDHGDKHPPLDLDFDLHNHQQRDPNPDAILVDYEHEHDLVDVSVPTSPAPWAHGETWTMLVADPPAQQELIVVETPAALVVEKPTFVPEPESQHSHLPSPPQSPVIPTSAVLSRPVVAVPIGLADAHQDDVASIPDELEDLDDVEEQPSEGLVIHVPVDEIVALVGPVSAIEDIPDEEVEEEKTVVEQSLELAPQFIDDPHKNSNDEVEPSIAHLAPIVAEPFEEIPHQDEVESFVDEPVSVSEAVASEVGPQTREGEVDAFAEQPAEKYSSVEQLVPEEEIPPLELAAVQLTLDVDLQTGNRSVIHDNVYETHDELAQQFDLDLTSMPDIPTPVDTDVVVEDPPLPELPLPLLPAILVSEVVPDPEELPLPMLRVDTNSSTSVEDSTVRAGDLASAISVPTEDEQEVKGKMLEVLHDDDDDSSDSEDEEDSVDAAVSLLRRRRILSVENLKAKRMLSSESLKAKKEHDAAPPGDFPVEDIVAKPTPAQTRAITTTLITAFARQRSPLDAALAMQLRPGLGLGADGAWLVRFLMSFFGWLAILVAGGQDVELAARAIRG
uniref:Uncharacterized protein n=1 Tax=Mycena chlorophos TaxID=658473 RepID=A0ABQ0L191_MYCCL|nr:predicted protein [Mycena chlorophos]